MSHATIEVLKVYIQYGILGLQYIEILKPSVLVILAVENFADFADQSQCKKTLTTIILIPGTTVRRLHLGHPH